MKQKTSPIWNYFLEINDSTAKCNICEKVYSRKGRTTTALKNHLKAVHRQHFEEFEKLDEVMKELLAKKEQTSSPTIQSSTKQTTLQESLNKNVFWDSSHQKSKQMDRLIAEMIALQGLPLNFVEGTGFRRVINAAIPRYELRGHQFFTSLLYDDLYHKATNKIKQLLEEFEKVSFTTGTWLELCSGTSLFSLTAHGISKDFRKVSIILKCEILEEGHTSKAISLKFQSVLQEWGIKQQKIHCVVHDQDSNIIEAMQLSNINDFNCTIHQIQSCIKNVIQSEEWLEQLIERLEKIETHFNHSQVAQEELQKIQTERFNQSALSPVQDCSTRWNSTFYMMERFLQIKDSLVLYLTTNQIAAISPDDWLNIEKCLKILKPFEEVTRELSSSQVGISSVIPLILVLLTNLQNEERKVDTSKELKKVTKKLIDELNSKFGDLTKNSLCTISTYLDPRYKTKFFSEIIIEEIESEILRLITTSNKDACDPPNSKKKRYSTNEYQNQPSTSWTNVSQIEFSLESILSTNESDQDDTKSDDSDENAMVKLKAMLQDYNKEKRFPLKEDPLMWWHRNAHKYSPLLPIVRCFLPTPPSSVASEQLFSGAALIYDEKRNRLQDEEADKLIFLKYNLPLLNFEY